MNPKMLLVVSILCILLLTSEACAAEAEVLVRTVIPTEEDLGFVQSPLSGLLQTPVMISPANGTTFTHLPRVMTLAWRPVSGADRYRVEIAYRTGSSWIPFAIATVSGQNTTFYQFEFVGDYPAVWRVTALGSTRNYIAIESLPSPWWSFSWNTRQTLTTPVLVSPGGGAVFSHYPRITTLAWNPVPGATSYLVERDILLGSAWSSFPNVTVIGAPNSVYAFDFGSKGSGRWRVTAIDGSTFGNSTSAWWQFSFLN
jgi:hypothetical protein